MECGKLFCSSFFANLLVMSVKFALVTCKPSLQVCNFCLLQPNPDPRIDAPTVGKVLLKARGFFTDDYWFWICIGALFGFSLLFNILFIAALTYLNRKRSHLMSALSFLCGN